MSSADGWGLLSLLKNDPRLEPIPVIVVSVLDEPQRALSQGAAAAVVKPFTRTELARALAQAGLNAATVPPDAEFSAGLSERPQTQQSAGLAEGEWRQSRPSIG